MTAEIYDMTWHDSFVCSIVWDLGGQTTIRPYWRCYYANTDAIIYVVDSADTDRLSLSKAELVSMLEEEELKTTALLVFANKQVMLIQYRMTVPFLSILLFF